MPTSTNNLNNAPALQVKINRLQARRAALTHKIAHANRSQRKARTRTLIQMGGILNMVGLPQLCGINEGDDLQIDIENQDKAAILLGALSHFSESLYLQQNENTIDTVRSDLLEKFKKNGIRILKDQAIHKHRV